MRGGRLFAVLFLAGLLVGGVFLVILLLFVADIGGSETEQAESGQQEVTVGGDLTLEPSPLPETSEAAVIDPSPIDESAATDSHGQTIERLIDEGFNAADREALTSILSEDYVGHLPTNERFDDVLTPAEYTEAVILLHQALPDLRVILDHLVVEGDFAVTHATLQGTFESEFYDTAPTGEPVNLEFMVLHRFGPDGQIVEDWIMYDPVALADQLGS